MPGYIQTAGSGSQVMKAVYVQTAGSGPQPALNVWIQTAGSGPQLLFSALTVSANNCSGGSSTAKTVTTSASTVTVTGGVGPFSYSWSITSDSNGTPTINSPSSQSTTFSAPINAATGSRDFTASCVVTDTATNVQRTASAYVAFNYTGTQS